MNLNEVAHLAISLMDKHNLYNRGWKFEFDNAKRRFGCCYYYERKITLSSVLCELNEEKDVRDVILHEIAHALVGAGHGHNRVWQRKAIEIGCNGKRCYDSSKVNTTEAPYIAKCNSCGKEHKRFRKPTKGSYSCGACSSTYNEKYKLTWKKS
jgi:predicted SprT family Zn-dependent metalloprotease